MRRLGVDMLCMKDWWKSVAVQPPALFALMASRTPTSQVHENRSPHQPNIPSPPSSKSGIAPPPHTFCVRHVIDHCRFSLLHQAVSLQLAVPPTPLQFRDRGQHNLPYDWAWCDIRFGNLVRAAGMQGDFWEGCFPGPDACNGWGPELRMAIFQ